MAESERRREAMPWDAVDEQSAQLLWHSDQALDRGELQMALGLADRAVARVPLLPDAHYQRGLILSNLARYDEAKASYLEVARLDPTYPSIWLIIGNMALRLREFNEAFEYYERQAELQPSSQLYVFMGVTLETLGRMDEARAAFERALVLDGRHAMAYENLSRLHMNDGNLEDAVTYARRALELEPDNPEFRYTLALHLVQSGRLDEGIRYLEEVVRVLPSHHRAHYNLGRALMQTGELEKGRAHLAEAERLQESEVVLPE
jgi:tetratricopeptide (TPR) repeat protein